MCDELAEEVEAQIYIYISGKLLEYSLSISCLSNVSLNWLYIVAPRSDLAEQERGWPS